MGSNPTRGAFSKNRTTKRAVFTRSPSIFAPPRRDRGDLRRGAEQKRSILNTFSEYLWSAKNFIFSILEQHDFTILKYLWRKKNQKMMHFFPGPAGRWGWAGLGWAGLSIV